MQSLDSMHLVSSHLRPKERGLWVEALSRGFAARRLLPPPETQSERGYERLTVPKLTKLLLPIPPSVSHFHKRHKNPIEPPCRVSVACLRVEGLAQQTASSVVHARVQALGGYLRHRQATLRRGFERIAAWRWWGRPT